MDDHEIEAMAAAQAGVAVEPEPADLVDPIFRGLVTFRDRWLEASKTVEQLGMLSFRLIPAKKAARIERGSSIHDQESAVTTLLGEVRRRLWSLVDAAQRESQLYLKSHNQPAEEDEDGWF